MAMTELEKALRDISNLWLIRETQYQAELNELKVQLINTKSQLAILQEQYDKLREQVGK